MTTIAATRTFPAYREVVQELVQEHLELTYQPLLLALYYASEREPSDIFLFEVADKFGGNWVSEDNELMEATFGAASGLSIDKDQRLHLILTNPNEFHAAIENCWQSLQEIRQAVKSGQFEILYADPSRGSRLFDAL
jgi:hypothetical protein